MFFLLLSFCKWDCKTLKTRITYHWGWKHPCLGKCRRHREAKEQRSGQRHFQGGRERKRVLQRALWYRRRIKRRWDKNNRREERRGFYVLFFRGDQRLSEKRANCDTKEGRRRIKMAIRTATVWVLSGISLKKEQTLEIVDLCGDFLDARVRRCANFAVWRCEVSVLCEGRKELLEKHIFFLLFFFNLLNWYEICKYKYKHISIIK